MGMWNDSIGAAMLVSALAPAGVRLPGAVADVAQPMNLSMLLSSLLFLLGVGIVVSAHLCNSVGVPARWCSAWTAKRRAKTASANGCTRWAAAVSASSRSSSTTKPRRCSIAWAGVPRGNGALFAAFQVGVAGAGAGVECAGAGPVLPRGRLAVAGPGVRPGHRLPAAQTPAGRRRAASAKKLAVEISTFIPLLRILFESGMAVEQSLRVLSNEGKLLLPTLTHELRLVLARVDSGLELGEELNKATPLAGGR